MDDQPPPPPPDQDTIMADADKIRAKRLAKLGGPSKPAAAAAAATTTGTAGPSPSPAASTPTSSTPTLPQAPSPKPVAQNPFSQLGMAVESKPTSRIHIKPKAANSSGASEDSIEAWEDHTLGAIFRVTLHSDSTRDGHGKLLCFLAGVRSDLEEEQRPIRLSTDILDQAILESASSKSEGKPLDYLLGCWKRVSRLFRATQTKQDPKHEILKEARRLCFSYCIFAATIPDMFGEEVSQGNPLVEHLLLEPENDRGLCHEFLTEAVSRFNEDESVKEVLVGAMEQLSRRLAKMSMNDDFKPYILAMRNFVRYQPLLIALSESPIFLPANIEPQQIETKSLLGPFFRLSPTQGEVALNYFASPQTIAKDAVSNCQNALRMTLQTHQDELFDIADCFIKKSKNSREKMLNWFALTVNANHKRRALQVDAKTVSTDGFMVNITVILDRLCEPFMDATFSKVDRVDVDYLRRSPRVDISDETKINADQKDSDAFYSTKVPGTDNFITEVFFLTVAAHHYGTEAANTKLSSLQREVKHLQKQLKQMEPERHKYASNPAQLAVFDDHIRKAKDRLDKGLCTIMATEGVLLDEVAQARSMQFMRYVIVWLLRLVSPGINFPRSPLQLPLPQQQPEAFKNLPEYFLEDIVDNFKFITSKMPLIITSTQSEELMMICIVFLRSSEYIKNPYLKSGLVTILYHGVWEVRGHKKGVLGDALFAHKFATKHLLHSLMKFYNECESTGAHTQFYDKFNIRYEIFQVIKCIWPNPIYRENLATEARVNLDFFVQFVNLLLNDVTFVLDESFTAFTQIHELSKVLKAPADDMDTNARTEVEEKLSAAQSKAKSYMQLTNETVAMLKLFTEALSDSFTKAEIVQRLAHMLDYNLDALVGPKKASLKVENPQDYGWDPKQMLSEISDVYLNLKDKELFINAIATDGRSYRHEHFTTAQTIMQRFALKSTEQLQEWARLADRIKVAQEEAELEEADLGEIPEEFTDPLLATLMEDPVILPTSRTVIDRSTIRSHLLSDPNDPFNRVPLTIDQVVPDTELKNRIQEWKSKMLTEKLAERAAASANEAMDTS
ncbi:ubiquitin conjugation factor E4 [Pleomassaria siparia CBS 279.74]|uniref:Ubiquitin conjugation factor E4 n=1 Tax=Pleomassaria siparia CBS 279.74 TaxID=1314801 RepID=A0A6G1K8H1_9PLEO|nr:ubiquitin conjugation factor E4 [Pleomassaria siparia CBS 279.74]